MAKDPAFLLYSSDFLTGTMFLSDEQVGKYIRLMCVQHQKGHLSEKDMLNICKTYDEDVYGKFQKDSNGLYYNIRLETEINKRKAYSESRRNNRIGKGNTSTTYVPHMEDDNEDENVNGFKIPTIQEVIKYFDDNGYTADSAKIAYENYRLQQWHDKNGKQIKNWKLKMNSVWFKEENKKTIAPVKKMVI